MGLVVQQRPLVSAPSSSMRLLCGSQRLVQQRLSRLQARVTAQQQAATLPNNAVFISNANRLVGVDPNRGGAIFWLSDTTTMENVVNGWDTGRLLQQSWYGYSDGSTWKGSSRPDKGWPWNPVQAGSWNNIPSRMEVIVISGSLPSKVTVTTTPRNWGGTQMLEDVKMNTTITILDDGRISMAASMTYSGDVKHPLKHQEAPACFFDPKYSILTYKDKDNNNAIVTTTPIGPSDQNLRKNADPTWAGYVNPDTGKGIYVSCPTANLLTAYRVNSTKHRPESNCSYLAPILRMAIPPKSTVGYETFIELK